MNDVSKPAPKRRAPTRRHKDTPLTVSDWVDAGSDLLVKETVRGIRIDALCAQLGVTKGSFYWHFGGRGDFLAAILKSWRARMTENIIERLDRLGDSATERLRRLFELPRRPRSERFARIEQSVRDWARSDVRAREAMRDVDVERLGYYRAQFEALGMDRSTAELRAYIAYSVMMGDSVLRQSLDSDAFSGDLVDEVMRLLTQPPKV